VGRLTSFCHEIIRELIKAILKCSPGILVRHQDYRFPYLFNVDKLTLKLEFFWQPNCLTAAILE